ncbi:MAG: glutamate racemase [Deltaproteobacteria bacterium]|nr:MAG: glutamate racemase [Deltaproteobacteria bacterium]
MADPRPIGVFDSGVGGLSVVAALEAALPAESIVYLGDTARLPYGTKSPQTVERYALSAARALVAEGVKMVVIACNTASAVALDAVRRALAPVPVVGVVEPGAAAAVATGARRVLVLATEGTIRGGAYERAIAHMAPDVEVVGVACPLFVALAEEGWTCGEIPVQIARHYLQAHLSPRPDAIVLGCTHFPLLSGVVAEVAGPAVRLVDSAETTARRISAELHATGLAAARRGSGGLVLLATDGAERFARVGSRFLARPIGARDVRIVNLP